MLFLSIYVCFDIGATIRIGWEIHCLPYVEFFTKQLADLGKARDIYYLQINLNWHKCQPKLFFLGRGNLEGLIYCPYKFGRIFLNRQVAIGFFKTSFWLFLTKHLILGIQPAWSQEKSNMTIHRFYTIGENISPKLSPSCVTDLSALPPGFICIFSVKNVWNYPC